MTALKLDLREILPVIRDWHFDRYSLVADETVLMIHWKHRGLELFASVNCRTDPPGLQLLASGPFLLAMAYWRSSSLVESGVKTHTIGNDNRRFITPYWRGDKIGFEDTREYGLLSTRTSVHFDAGFQHDMENVVERFRKLGFTWREP